MGQELIKSTVDASDFVINLTRALIRFVMTAALVPGRCTTSRGGGSVHGGQWLTWNIRHNPSITSAVDDTAVASLFGVWRQSPFKRRGFAR